MSDSGCAAQRWQAPDFGPSSGLARPSLEQQEATAQARGFEAGRAEGLKSGMAEAEELVERMTALVQAMAHPFRALDAQVTRELAQMAMVLAREIVRRELTVDSSIVTEIMTEAMLTLYKLEGEIVVFVNPADAMAIRSMAPEFLEEKTWKVVEDAALLPGGCQVKTPVSFVDASIEKQMEVVFANLMESCDKGLDL